MTVVITSRKTVWVLHWPSSFIPLRTLENRINISPASSWCCLSLRKIIFKSLQKNFDFHLNFADINNDFLGFFYKPWIRLICFEWPTSLVVHGCLSIQSTWFLMYHHWISREYEGVPAPLKEHAISTSWPLWAVTSWGTSVNMAGHTMRRH